MSEGSPNGQPAGITFVSLRELMADAEPPEPPARLVDKFCAAVTADTTVNRADPALIVLQLAGTQNLGPAYAREFFSFLAREFRLRMKTRTLLVDMRGQVVFKERLFRLMRERNECVLAYDDNGVYRLIGEFPRHSELVMTTVVNGAGDETAIQAKTGLPMPAITTATRFLLEQQVIGRVDGKLKSRLPGQLSVSGRHLVIQQGDTDKTA